MKDSVMKAHTADQQATAGTRRLRRLTVFGATFAVLLTGACSSATPTASGPTVLGTAAKVAPAVLTDDQYLKNASAYIDAAKETWDAQAKTVKIDLGEMYFKPKDVSLEAGKPYVLELVNTGKVKHEFTAAKFFRGSAIRKVESSNSEVKAQYFTEVEVFAGKTAKIFVIPVVTGSFKLLCEIDGHREAGMEGTITVTGTTPTSIPPAFGSVKAGPWLQTGEAVVDAAKDTWDVKQQTLRVEAGENGAKMFFKPTDVALKVGTPYKLEFVNVGKVKHEFTSSKFFPTMAFRKAEDSDGEFKTPLLKEAEVFAGKKLDLFLIPTKAGTYKIVCELPGHEKAGMFGTITVSK